MHCWKCGAPLEEPPGGKIAFRATCDACLAWLHCCRNCKNYQPGKPNDCLIPGTDIVKDREVVNFCEEFNLLGVPPKFQDLNKVSQKLFGNDLADTEKPTENPKNKFKNLFED